jgi:hypothetical protein
MFLKSISNFYYKFRNEISEILSHDGNIVDSTVGILTPEEVIKIALVAAREKEFVNDDGKPSLTADLPRLFHYTRRKQLVWLVDFNQYFTEEERKNEYKGYDDTKSITFAVVKIDDATREVISAEFIRPHFNQYYGEAR